MSLYESMNALQHECDVMLGLSSTSKKLMDRRKTFEKSIISGTGLKCFLPGRNPEPSPESHVPSLICTCPVPRDWKTDSQCRPERQTPNPVWPVLKVVVGPVRIGQSPVFGAAVLKGEFSSWRLGTVLNQFDGVSHDTDNVRGIQSPIPPVVSLTFGHQETVSCSSCYSLLEVMSRFFLHMLRVTTRGCNVTNSPISSSD